MRLGIDGRKIPEAVKRGPIASFDHARELGLAGLFFRTVLDLSPTLDGAYLRDIRQKADALGMYMEAGLAKVNPYALAEAPEVRMVGSGDVLLGFRRMMEACAAIECRELWVALCNYKTAYVGKFCTDRFRTDVDWADQLAATEKFLKRLAPMARDLGIHLNLETHEELSSFEVVRLVEAVGPDVMGIVYDTGNMLQRGEHPVWVARRVAPYVRQTHIKDAILTPGPRGIHYHVCPCGQGAVDFAEILPVLAKARPQMNLSIENNESYEDRPRTPIEMLIEAQDPVWRAAHPDLSAEEFDAFLSLAENSIARARAQGSQTVEAYLQNRPGYTETLATIRASATHIRTVCAGAGLGLD
jgi:sugar phosphate isomerase/epimerase